MFNAKITFNLIIVTSSGTRSLSITAPGDGEQEDEALGTYSPNSYISDYLVKFNCKAEKVDFDQNNYQIQIDDLLLEQANGYFPFTDIPVPYSLKDKDISQYKYDDIEREYGKDYTLYLFIQKADSNGRRLSDGSRCSISNNEASLNIDGTVEREKSINNRTFTLKTSDNKNANCTLSKEAGINDAKLICAVKNPGKRFYLIEDNYIAIDGKGDDYMVFTANNTDTPLCKYYTNDDSDRSDSSSSSGLSGGAIAGIVIASVVVVVVLGTIIFFVSKGIGLFGGVKAGTSAYSEAGSSSISNMKISELKK